MQIAEFLVSACLRLINSDQHHISVDQLRLHVSFHRCSSGGEILQCRGFWLASGSSMLESGAAGRRGEFHYYQRDEMALQIFVAYLVTGY